MDLKGYPIELSGDVDFARKHELDAVAAGFESSDAADASVAMRQVTFIDSSGLGFLIRLRNAADSKGGQVEVVQPSARVMDLLRLVNLDGRFLVRDPQG